MSEFKVNQESLDYLERLAYEVDGKVNLIDYILTSHKNDTDNSIINSKPFQHLLQDYEKASAEYLVAKTIFEKENNLTNKKWNLDFLTGICTVK